MTDQAYIAACQKLSAQYNDNQSSMADYLTGMQNLKAQYLQGKPNATLPIVP